MISCGDNVNIANFLDEHPSFQFDLKECLSSFLLSDHLRKKQVLFDSFSLGQFTERLDEENVFDSIREFAPTTSHYESYNLQVPFGHLPYLSKSYLRRDPLAFCNTKNNPVLYQKTSSGSRGRPVNAYYSRQFYFEELFLNLRRIAQFKKVGIGKRNIFSASLHNSLNRPSMVFKDPLEELGLMTRLAFDERRPSSVIGMLKVLVKLQPELIVSKPPIFEALIQLPYCTPYLKDVRPSLVVSSGCSLELELRQNLVKTFDCPVTNAYATSEIGLVGAECPSEDGFHIDTTSLLPEIRTPDNPNLSHDGELVLSSIRNTGMLLIRYRTGDRGRLKTEVCSCKCPSPKFIGVRQKEIPCFQLADGSAFDPTRLNALIYSNVAICHFQAVQISPGNIILKLYAQIEKRSSTSSMRKIKEEIRKQVQNYCPNCRIHISTLDVLDDNAYLGPKYIRSFSFSPTGRCST